MKIELPIVLGYLIEVVSGKSLAQFLQERIFAHLGMDDTGFFIDKNRFNSLMVAYTPKY
ncbi:MAG: serine hydrolase [Okeania sp. SIO2C9]|uniref:serine hydrolase n=1 Tax=Okeania sp. SIO2C9 TaxID=2607791 RepID=UPI0013C0A217|nr:serine hydrolase [Okeania sp. SIO2C9]NEQ74300.1 serine hydrolase [Okeania sp. SIO2C9]